MIGRLRGILIEKNPPDIIIEVNGVGYEVSLPMTSFYELGELNQEIILYTHFVVREDAQLLYGFHSKQERSLFRELIKVSGFGPKLALAILSGMSSQQFIHAVEYHEIDMLIKLPGVGKKTAERLIIEMKDRLKRLDKVTLTGGIHINDQLVGHAVNRQAESEAEAIAALIALGYKPLDANRMITKLALPDADSEMLIREALRAAL